MCSFCPLLGEKERLEATLSRFRFLPAGSLTALGLQVRIRGLGFRLRVSGSGSGDAA